MIPARIVLDTNVCLDLFVFRDPGCEKLMKALKSGIAKAFTNDACREEWLRVLDYSQIALDGDAKLRCMAEFDSLISIVCPAKTSPVLLPSCSDADDQKFLELARDANIDFLLTKDKALLKLNRRVMTIGLFSIIRPFEINSLLLQYPHSL